MSKRLISGIQPSGILHLGNYLGAIKTWRSQRQNSLYFIADSHSITTRFYKDNTETIDELTIKTAACLIACGIDKNLFVQSHIPQHFELMWILSCMTPKSWLNKMIQYKEKSQDNNATGLYTYPILMAADILLYKAEEVPVGDDQIQHIECARDIAIRLNKVCGVDIIPIPNYLLSKAPRIMSLQNGKVKMSKSDKSSLSCLSLIDDEETIKHKILKAKTDPVVGINYEPENRPEVSNLINIYSALEGISKEEVVKRFENSKMLEFKMEIIKSLCREILPISKKANEILNDRGYIKKILLEGKNNASEMAEKNLDEIKRSLKYLI
jgi:tryptophanyl-tRNA synthetase